MKNQLDHNYLPKLLYFFALLVMVAVSVNDWLTPENTISKPKPPLFSWSGYIANTGFMASYDTLRHDTLAVLRYELLKLGKEEKELMQRSAKRQLKRLRLALKAQTKNYQKLAKRLIARVKNDQVAAKMFGIMHESQWRKVLYKEPENLTEHNEAVYELFMPKETKIRFAAKNDILYRVRKLGKHYYAMHKNGWLERVSPHNVYQAHTELLVEGKPVELGMGTVSYKNSDEPDPGILPIPPEIDRIKKHLYVVKTASL